MIRLAFFLLILLFCPALVAASLQELLGRDQLRLRSWTEPNSGIAVGQEVRLVIEISTRRWFAGGTRIRHPEVPGLIVLQRDGFATNLSRREADQTWVIQQWQLELYPQLEGRFEIPAISLELAVNDATAGIVRGTLATEPTGIAAAIPELMRNTPEWLAASDFSVQDKFDRELVALQPGDAFSRTLTFTATNLTAMMLPDYQPQAPDGLAIYPDQPRLENRSNRGEATAVHTETITYVVERAGRYQLPALNFNWWNTRAARPQLTSLAAVTIDAGRAPGAAAASFRLQKLPWHYLLALLPLLAAAWLYRRLPQRENRLLKKAQRLVRKGQYHAATQCLYLWLNQTRPMPDWHSLRHTAARAGDPNLPAGIEALLVHAYSRKPGPADPRPVKLGGLRLALKRLQSPWFRKPELVINNLESNAAAQREGA